MRQPTSLHIVLGISWIAILGPTMLRSAASEGEAVTPEVAAVSPNQAIDPAAPPVPAELAAAMQEGRYPDVRRLLTALVEKAKTADERAYFGYLRAIAERLAGNQDIARETLRTALLANPETRWSAKIRFELAGIELAAGNLDAAEQLTRQEAEHSSLATGRTDWPASISHSPVDCSSRTIPWSASIRMPRTACWSRRVNWPRARPCADASPGDGSSQPGREEFRQGRR